MLGEQLKKARENNKLSQNEVAEKLNISRQSISKWENNRTSPDLDNLIRLSKLYNISLDELLNEQLDSEYKNSSNISGKIKLYQSENQEWLFLLILCVVSSFVSPIGLIIVPFILFRNKKNCNYHKFIIFLCILCSLINLYQLYIMFRDYYNSDQQIIIEKLDIK